MSAGLAGSRAAPFAHHVQPQRGVGDLGGDVHVPRSAVQGIEVAGERLPLPVEAFVEDRPRDVLDPLHQLDQPLVVVGANRGETDPQFPMTTVVTPCHADGVREESQIACPS